MFVSETNVSCTANYLLNHRLQRMVSKVGASELSSDFTALLLSFLKPLLDTGMFRSIMSLRCSLL